MDFNKSKVKLRKGFSLIELIFVIVVVGIIASVSLSLIFNVYQNYITQRAVSQLTQEVNILGSQLYNYISKRIRGTIIAKEFNNPVNHTQLDSDTEGNYTVLEWIGYDYDSFSSSDELTWSGIADYTDITKDNSSPPDLEVSFKTPASDLEKAAIILNNLSNEKVDLSKNKPAGIIFETKENIFTQIRMPGTNVDIEYHQRCMGLIDNNISCIFAVHKKDDTSLVFNNTKKIDRYISERYKLSWTAYSIFNEKQTDSELSNLYLYYNYQPWNGEKLEGAKRSLLAKNISVFKYVEHSKVIKFKICLQARILDQTISSCKLVNV